MLFAVSLWGRLTRVKGSEACPLSGRLAEGQVARADDLCFVRVFGEAEVVGAGRRLDLQVGREG